MSRFFVPKENIKDDIIIINSDDVSHISRVLRLTQGDEIICCDGAGNDYNVSISEVSKKEIICKILSKTKTTTETEKSNLWNKILCVEILNK